MDRTAVFPGSFDPVTLGHMDIIERSSSLFDRLIIAIGVNSSKTPAFSLEKRMKWLKELTDNIPNAEVHEYGGLTIDFCRQVKAGFIVRGLRSAADLDYEGPIAHSNKVLEPGIETIFILSSPELSHISATIVRDIIRNGREISAFLPAPVARDIRD